MKIMGVDYGDARTGIAISDLLCSIVGSTLVIHSRNMDKTIQQICDLVIKNGVEEIVDNYDVDGIHMDDYFYPAKDAAFDRAEFLASGFDDLGDFRRGNINTARL